MIGLSLAAYVAVYVYHNHHMSQYYYPCWDIITKIKEIKENLGKIFNLDELGSDKETELELRHAGVTKTFNQTFE